jgi:uncharacterized protein YndB with AHSA1/START domain
MATGDVATVTVAVPVPPARAFELFTRDIDAWWQRGPRFRNAVRVPSRMVLEAGVGGTFVELLGEGDAAQRIEIGRVLEWSPPDGFAMRWRNSNFADGEHTHVDVRFVAVGRNTHVTVRHSGWAALRDDHPARHGRVGSEFTRWHGMWWGDALRGFARHCD